jgi:hypothetical protein
MFGLSACWGIALSELIGRKVATTIDRTLPVSIVFGRLLIFSYP